MQFPAECKRINHQFNIAWKQARFLLAFKPSLLSDSNRLDEITNRAKKFGFFTLDDSLSTTEDRLARAQKLAQLCIAHPTRTQVLSRILPDQGILSSKKRGD